MRFSQLAGVTLKSRNTDTIKTETDDLKAIIDYNIMMGFLEDPSGEDDSDE